MGTRLPYKRIIKLKDFDNDPKYKELKGIHGICNEGKDGNEIWLNKNKSKLPTDTIQLTRIHELVHLRRQESTEENKNWRFEEDLVEFEAIARAKKKDLSQAQRIIKDFLTNIIIKNKKIRLYPDKPKDLKLIHNKIKHILKYKYFKNKR